MISRNTRQKDSIDSAIKSIKGFFNAEELHEVVKKTDETIGLATIYRNLKAMVSLGELFVYTCDRRQVYSQTKQHCHFIDEKTGEVTHFQIENLDFLKGKIPGTIESLQIEVRGQSK